ncbi:hypothetical protein BDN71DRAFT_1435825 [Pleurotus eryngii]|uniref:Uncharacterized protein n=1 Tax=Pleurotus eryngii TaxID=5323 RepID=A0A9P5ZJV6_PLEER|nr:hypothetical protein BDN71DRAFT_1435825 [Pleurotus eryngii]
MGSKTGIVRQWSGSSTGNRVEASAAVCHRVCMMLVKELLAWPVPVQSLEWFTQLCTEQAFTPLVTYHNNSFDWDLFHAEVLKVAIIGEVRLPQTDVVGRGAC